MTIEPLSYLPGVCKVNSPVASPGRITDMNGARFVAGYPEKLGGWVFTSTNTLTGVPRGLKDWRDLSANVYLGIGTHKKLYVFNQGTATDITPFRGIQTGTLTNAFVTSSASTTVTVTHGTHRLQTGDYVKLTAGTSVGGITPAGLFNPITVTGTNNYTFVNPSAATAAGTGGGNIAYTYYRTTLTNPFATTTASPTVRVTHTAHGASTGDFVEIAGASAVAGLTLSGEYTLTVVDANSYNITASGNASSTTTGGGTPNFQYDVSVGTANASTSFGYGSGGYGSSGYGASTIGTTMPPRVWALSPYGQQLIASYYGGTIFVWDPTIGGRAYPLYNAPSTVLWSFITHERFIFALGINGQFMEVAWPDQDDYTDWTSTAINTANEGRALQNGSYIVGGIAVRDGVSIVFTNTTAYPFTYSGDSFVYNDQAGADGCGLIGPLAVNVESGNAYWMGNSEFWMWNGVVQPIGSDDIRDYVFQNINLSQSYKFVCGTNIAKKEIWFFYVSAAGTEIDSYVIYHIDQACWSIGDILLRTSWIDRGLFATPIATDVNGYIYSQESGNDAAGLPLNSFITLSPISIGKGQSIQDIFGFIPDFERQAGTISLTLLTQQYPEDTISNIGPYTLSASGSTPKIDIRASAKLIGFELQSNVLGGDYRLGLPTVDIQQGGARR